MHPEPACKDVEQQQPIADADAKDKPEKPLPPSRKHAMELEKVGEPDKLPRQPEEPDKLLRQPEVPLQSEPSKLFQGPEHPEVGAPDKGEDFNIQEPCKPVEQPQPEGSEVKQADGLEMCEGDGEVVMVGEEMLEEELDKELEKEQAAPAPVVLRVEQFKQKMENHPPGRRGRPPKKGDSKHPKPRAKATAKAEAKSKAKPAPKTKAKSLPCPQSRRRKRITIDDIIPPTPAPPRQSMPAEPESAPEPAPATAAPAKKGTGKKRAAEPSSEALRPSASSAPSAPSSGPAEVPAPKKRAKKQKKAGPNESAPVPDQVSVPGDSEVPGPEPAEGEKAKEKSFARRAPPMTQPALMKWRSIRDVFQEQVRAQVNEFSRFPGKYEEKGSSQNPTFILKHHHTISHFRFSESLVYI